MMKNFSLGVSGSDEAVDYAKIQTEAPLFNQLLNLAELELQGFHMPGNNAGKAFPPGFREGWSRLETTELDSSGDVLSGSGAVAEAWSRAANFAEAGACFFITQGSSTGLMTALAVAARFSKRILLPRTVHAAVIRGMALLDLEPVFLPLVELPSQQLPQLDIKAAVKAIEKEADGICLLLTRPDYYGSVLELGELLQAIHRKNGLLLVDEAHGAHLSIKAPELPESALKLGADLVCQSAHKTWPALAPAALIQLGKRAVEELNLAELCQAELRLFHSTSPSFPIAASIDWARAYLELYGGSKIAGLRQALAEFSEALPQGFKILNPRLKLAEEPAFCRNYDLLHLLIELPYYRSPEAWSKEFRRVGIELELVNFKQALLLLNLDLGAADFQLLKRRLEKLSRNLAGLERDLAQEDYFEKLSQQLFGAYQKVPKRVVSIREARLKTPVERIPLLAAEGRIAGELLAPYPPGLPLLWPGELIDSELIQLISDLAAAGLDILGLQDAKIAVLME